MSTTLKLPFKRFIAQVSTGAPRSKGAYRALMDENVAALKECEWREAADVPASLTGHDFTAKTQFADAYDAFKLTGNYDTSAMTEIAYAGMAAYRFTVPASARTGGGVPVASIALPVSRDRFEKSGVHLAVVLSDSETPSMDWDVVRGTGSLSLSSQLEQMDVANLMAGAPEEDTVTVSLSGVSIGNPSAYIWVYVTLENYTDTWEMYNTKEKRLYAIEGSAMLAGGSAEFIFDGTVTADPDSGPKYLTKSIPVHVTHLDDYSRVLRPGLGFTLLSVASVSSAADSSVGTVLLPVATWTVEPDVYELPFNGALDTNGRRIPEGDYILECWIDDGDGKYNVGEPYGCTDKVFLSASSEPDRMSIELLDASPSVIRMDLVEACREMKVSNSDMYRHVDRGLIGAFQRPSWLMDSGASSHAYTTGTGLPWATSFDMSFNDVSNVIAPPDNARLVHVLVLATHADMSFDTRYSIEALRCMCDVKKRPFFTEANLIAAGKQELYYNAAPVNAVLFRTNINDSPIPNSSSYGHLLPVGIVNMYDENRVNTAPVSSSEVLTHVGRPTFRWTHSSAIGKPYPAFKLRIYSDSGKTNLVYDSGVRHAPAREADRTYEWTAPVYVGLTTDQDVTLASETTYYWAVSMIDARYTEFSSTEPVAPFRLLPPAGN